VKGDGEIDSQSYSESKSSRQTVEENVRESPQQPETEQLAMSESQTADSQNGPLLCASLPAMGFSRTQNVQHSERPISGKQTVNVQVNMKTSTAPEKKQQVAVVHAHERTYPRVENRALSRIRDEELQTSMRRQPTLESHLSIESTSSQLSQASLLWQNEQLQAGTRHQDAEQTATLQQQYEQLKYQLQQQLDLQRSQLEREYQLREEQMKQQMMMQWQYFTQQQQQQQQQWQMFSDVRQNRDTRCQDAPRCIASFPRVPGPTEVSSTYHPRSVSAQQQVQPPQNEFTDDRQRCACDNVVQSDAPRCIASFPRVPGPTDVSGTYHPGSVSAQQQVQPPHNEFTDDRQRCACDNVVQSDSRAVPAKARRNHHYHQRRPVVVDVISHTRGRDGDRGGRWSGYDGGHCRITVGNGEQQHDSSDNDTESEEQTSGAADWHVCPTCGLCRRQYETSDGKDRRCYSHRAVAFTTPSLTA